MNSPTSQYKPLTKTSMLLSRKHRPSGLSREGSDYTQRSMDALRFTKSHALALNSRNNGTASYRTNGRSPMFNSMGGHNGLVTGRTAGGDVSAMRKDNVKLEKLYSYLQELPKDGFSKAKYESKKQEIFEGEDETLEKEVDQLNEELKFLERYEKSLKSDIDQERRSTAGKSILTKLDSLIAAAEEVARSLEEED